MSVSCYKYLSSAGTELLEDTAALVSEEGRCAAAPFLFFPAGHLILPFSKKLNFPRSESVYGVVINQLQWELHV